MNKRMLSLALALLLILSVVFATTSALAASCRVCGSNIVTTYGAWVDAGSETKIENGVHYIRYRQGRQLVTRCASNTNHYYYRNTEYKWGPWYISGS